jgi:signal transduction histidine kinase
MIASASRLVRLGRRVGLEPVDVWFAGLRAAALAGALVWWRLEPDTTRAPELLILAIFLVFSLGLYGLNAIRPGRIELLYRTALVFDLLIAFFLVRISRDLSSDVWLAFALLIAVHAFYFGLTTGLATATVASALYALAAHWPLPARGFALRVGFFLLVGLCMGILSEVARRQRDELSQQQEQLMRSDRLATVGELATGLAHELRNPLAGISGALRVLSDQLPRNDEWQHLLVDIQGQISRMNKTLTDLLQQARPAKPQQAAVNVNTVLEQSLRFMPLAGIEVVQHLDPTLPLLEADPNLLHQAFLNILVNARQAMPHGGRLTVESRARDGSRPSVEISIGDTGLGISPEHATRIFQPFFTTKPHGTGLGLAIAARVIEQHGGRITVDSTPGIRTVFTIVLPAPLTGERQGSHRHATPSTDR